MFEKLQQSIFVLLLAVAAANLTGCGSDGLERFYLSGHVSYDGQPIDDGEIVFSPVDRETGKAAGGPIVNGTYEVERALGPTAGKYKVMITAMRPSGKKSSGEGSTPPTDILEQFIPAAYNEATTLEVDVTDDNDALDFALDKAAPAPRH